MMMSSLLASYFIITHPYSLLPNSSLSLSLSAAALTHNDVGIILACYVITIPIHPSICPLSLQLSSPTMMTSSLLASCCVITYPYSLVSNFPLYSRPHPPPRTHRDGVATNLVVIVGIGVEAAAPAPGYAPGSQLRRADHQCFFSRWRRQRQLYHQHWQKQKGQQEPADPLSQAFRGQRSYQASTSTRSNLRRQPLAAARRCSYLRLCRHERHRRGADVDREVCAHRARPALPAQAQAGRA